MKWGYILQVYGMKKKLSASTNYRIENTVIGYTIQSLFVKLLDNTVYQTAEDAWKALEATGHSRLPGITR